MLPLQEVQQIFTWFCICPINKNTSRLASYLRVWFTIVHYIFQATILCSSIIYFLKYLSIDFSDALYVFCQAVGLGNGLYCITVGIFKRDKINSLFTTFQEFYTESKYACDYIRINTDQSSKFR